MIGADSADHGRSGLDGMSVLMFPGTGADSADHGHSGVDGISLPSFPVTDAESPVHAYFGVDGMSVMTFPGTGADSANHGRSGVDGISLPTFRVTSAESPVTLILETTGSLFQSMFLLTHPITYSAANVHSNFISSSSPYFFPNLPLHQGVVYIIRPILWPAVFDGTVRDRYGSQQILWPAVMYNL